jgi:hypothetical protein
MDQPVGNVEAVVSNRWEAKIYKRCDKQCQKCRQCREFEKLIEQINTEERSALERQREAEKMVRGWEK